MTNQASFNGTNEKRDVKCKMYRVLVNKINVRNAK